jgi:hypothetical protein
MQLLAHLAAALLTGAPAPILPPSQDWDERYTYETVRAGDASSTRVERVSMEYMATNGTLYMHYRAENERGCEEMSIRCDLTGSNVTATKQEYTKSGATLSDATIWVDGSNVHVGQRRDKGGMKIRTRDTGGTPVAAEASLMAMLRFFPFDTDQTLEVLIATFTQHFVTMSVRQRGSETITTPAGTFECYKIEGIVDLYVTSIKTTYWLTKAKPYFMVRYEGKRGLFLAPTYVTSLSSLVGEQGADRQAHKPDASLPPVPEPAR